MITRLVDIINNLLGNYSPIYYVEPNTQEVVVSVDWSYIVSAVVFIVVLWSVLRMIGGLLCSNR